MAEIDKSKEEDSDSFYAHFYKEKPSRVPVIYSDQYNISFLGLEKLHPFDSCKYQNIVKRLLTDKVIDSTSDLIEPINMPTEEQLKEAHSDEYLKSLTSSIEVAKITEIPIVAALPNFLVRWRVLNPFLYATSGSITAARIAIQRGFAVNLGGGFHHCCGHSGGGFCAYADITLSYRFARKYHKSIQKVMIIDLDAHQGNGHARDKVDAADQDVYILDVFNPYIYPGDDYAKQGINKMVHVASGTNDEVYLNKLAVGIRESFDEFTPDLIIYNAGTDILAGDPLGRLDVSADGVKQRDKMVFDAAVKRKIPLVMLLSGGYQKSNAAVIAESLEELHAAHGLLSKATM